MGCHHGSGYHWSGYWEPGDWRTDVPAYEAGYGYGRPPAPGYGRRFAWHDGPTAPTSAVSQLESHLAALRDEMRAVEADLAAMRADRDPDTSA